MNDSNIQLHRLFLPYHRLFEGERGWQFGVPSSDPKSPYGFRLLAKNGDLYELDSPDLRSPREGAPRPEWAWVPFRADGEVRYATIRSPEKGPGSYPLTELKEHGTSYIEAPGGREAYFDLQQEIPCDREDGYYTVYMGMTRILRTEVRDEKVARIYPIESAHQIELWTSHLARIVSVFKDQMRPANVLEHL